MIVKLRDKISRIPSMADAFFCARPFFALLIFSFALCFVIECLCRHSFFGGVAYVFKSPVVFLLNVLIIASTLSPALVLGKRYFYLFLVGTTWLGFGVTNCVVLSYRVTPFGFVDMTLLRSVWGIIDVYLTVWQIILIFAAIAAAIGVCVLIWKKSRGARIPVKKAGVSVIATVLTMAVMLTLGSRSGALPSEFGNLANAYNDYGFAYCFSRSVVDRGIDETDDYSHDVIKNILSSLPSDNGAHDNPPNVVFLQLESFFDAKQLLSVSYSEDPTPNFTALKNSCPHGALYVPSLGAGTANTEFEVLTGMSISHFGAGEYPYKSVLKDTAAESMAYNYSALGYSAHAIHNHEGSFYDRNEIYSYLGFDTFTSIEYMEGVEHNPLGWAKDRILIPYIFKAIESTDERDFVFAVSVQAHGKYPREVIDSTQRITLDGMPDEETDIAFEYYVNQLCEEDAFLGELIAAIAAYDEPIVLVAYGDHLPAFEIDDKQLYYGDVFTTEYIIYSNVDLGDVGRRDMQAYELSAYVMGLLGYNQGVFTKLHQTYGGDADFDGILQTFEYDVLYGDEHTYEYSDAPVRTDMRMGIDEISITRAYNIGESGYISGENFTMSSIVYINGKKENTHHVGSNILCLPSTPIKDGDVITVAQSGNDGIVLSFSREYVFGE